MKSTSLLLSLLLLLSKEANAERGEAANVACSSATLANHCPDESVDLNRLNEYCSDKRGVHLAHCFMHYLCKFHDQDAVNSLKPCIDEECPLAVHVPPLQCDATTAPLATLAPQEEEANENNNNNDNEEAPAEETMEEEQPVEEENNEAPADEAEDPIDEEEVTEEIIEGEQKEEEAEPQEEPEDTATESNNAEDFIDEKEVTEEIVEGEEKEGEWSQVEEAAPEEKEATAEQEEATTEPPKESTEPTTTMSNTISPGMIFSLVVILGVFLGGLSVLLGVDRLMGYLSGSKSDMGKHQPVNLAPVDREFA